MFLLVPPLTTKHWILPKTTKEHSIGHQTLDSSQGHQTLEHSIGHQVENLSLLVSSFSLKGLDLGHLTFFLKMGF
jgi:hypothetical protein